jgi:hypothetical protein
MKKSNYLLLVLLFIFGCTKKNVADKLSPNGLAVAQASPAGDVVGKITVGYQGWFACTGDGSPINAWWHWATNWSQPPSPTNVGIKSWPDVRDYTSTYATAFPNLNNGSQARLFSSFNDQTVNTQFQWMQQYNLDCAALQRFNPTGGEGPVRDAITAKVKTAAETYGRKFYIMYDVTAWTNMQSEIKTDWINKMSAYTSSSAYARQNGKPVVCIWGFGFDDDNHPWSADVCLDVINFFKAQGCYVIGGVPRGWRTGTDGSRANYLNMYKAFNMISPWMIGAIGDIQSSDNIYNSFNVPDQAYCNQNGIDYQPCVIPGDLQERQRKHGDFMWHQFYNMVKLGAQGLYISMFDEYNEGNQIAKTAETQAFVPAGSGMLSLDEDGTACSADYYMRLAGDGGRMLKGQIALTSVRPTEPIVGGGTGTVTPPIGQVITLKGANNLYVSSEDATKAMNCNRAAVGGWEMFTVVDAGGGKVSLQNSGFYMSSENGTQAINCNRTAIGPWEQFDWIANSDGTISLRGNNGAYISSEGGTTSMTCTRTTISATEKFRVNQ